MISRQTTAAIKIAQKSAGLADDDYRTMLKRVAGVDSSTKLDAGSAGRVLEELDRLGAKPWPKASRRPMASQPLARKARAIWLMLHNLDQLESGSEKALNAFAKRITGKDDMTFSDNAELNKVVEALKAWSLRAGVSAETADGYLAPHFALVREQWARLVTIPYFAAYGVGDLGLRAFTAARGITMARLDLMNSGELNSLAKALGSLLRGHKLGRHVPQENEK
jgi:phage gp16-like protein